MSLQQATSHNLAARGLRPVADLARNRAHGDRLRYMAGCRCQECRRANTDYEKQRAQARKAGQWNGIVSAERSRAHMQRLSAEGVGRRQVGDVTGVADSILAGIVTGKRTHCRAHTERLILAVTPAAMADGALIDAAPTWKLLDELIADGYTKRALALQLGNQSPALQLRRSQVTLRNAYDVKLLYERLHFCDASRAMKFLAELREEGFILPRLTEKLRKLAQELGQAEPDLTVRNGRMLASTARLIERLHAQLMEE